MNRFVTLLLALACAFILPAQAFDMQSHRGGRGLLPENTLAAFEHAIRMGTMTIELDIAITADGVPVISHDPALNPALTRDAQGRWLTRHEPLIKSLTLAELQTYDVGRLNPGHRYAREFPTQQPRDGQRIPTLASLFALVDRLGAHDLHFDIETKINPHHPNNTLAPEAFVDTLLGVIRSAGMTRRVMVQSFDWRTLELLHRKEPAIRTMYLSVDWPDYSTLHDSAWTAGHRLAGHGGSVPRLVRASARDAKGVIWAPNHAYLTPARLHEAHALGLKVIPWTVNDEPTMERLIDWGVDGIISDYPDRLRRVMARKGLPLPRPPAGVLAPVKVESGRWLRSDGLPIALKGANLGNWLMLEFWMFGYPDNVEVNDQCTLEAVLDRRFGRAERERLLALHRDHWISERDWNTLPRFGLNLVRIPFIWSLLEDEDRPMHLRADAWHYLDRAIDAAERRGLYVVLDLHGAVGAQGHEHHSGCAGRNAYWSTPAYRERTAWLWREVATRYRDHAAVAGYSLLNEPWGADAATMAQDMLRLYQVVRSADPHHAILLPGHSSGIDAYGDVRGQGLVNTAFEMHFYPGHFGWGKPGEEVHRNWLECRPSGGTCEWRDRLAAQNAAFFVGEFQPWADLDPELGARTTRASFDRYAELGWASAVWGYKMFTPTGGAVLRNWGLVTNADSDPFGLIDFHRASLAELEAWFRAGGTLRYQPNEGVLRAMAAPGR